MPYHTPHNAFLHEPHRKTTLQRGVYCIQLPSNCILRGRAWTLHGEILKDTTINRSRADSDIINDVDFEHIFRIYNDSQPLPTLPPWDASNDIAYKILADNTKDLRNDINELTKGQNEFADSLDIHSYFNYGKLIAIIVVFIILITCAAFLYRKRQWLIYYAKDIPKRVKAIEKATKEHEFVELDA